MSELELGWMESLETARKENDAADEKRAAKRVEHQKRLAAELEALGERMAQWEPPGFVVPGQLEDEQALERVMRSLQDNLRQSWADTFADIAESGLLAFGDLASTVLRTFRKLALDLVQLKFGPTSFDPNTPEGLRNIGDAGVPDTDVGPWGRLGMAAGVGIFSTGLSMFLDDMLNGADRAREAAEKMRQAQEQWEQILSDFTAIWSPRGALGDALEQLRRQYEAAKNQGAFGAVGFASKARADFIAGKYADQPLTGAFGGFYDRLILAGQKYRVELARLTDEYNKAVEATKERIRLERQRFGEDTQVEILRLQGQTSQADTLALQLQQARQLKEFTDSIDDDDWTDANKALLTLLGTLHEFQAAALLAAQAEEELRKARQREDISGGFAVRGLRLAGDTTGAGVLQAQIDFGLGIRELDDWLTEGFITVEQYAEYQAILNGEMAKTIDAINAEVAAREEAIVNFNQTLTDDLALRDLQNLAIISGAQADQEAYEDAARAAQHKRGVDEAVANGATEATLAAIAYSQSLDDQAVASQRAAEAAEEARRAEEELLRTRKAQLAFQQDLDVQWLQAIGQGAAAEDLQAQIDRARKLQEATDLGLGQDVLDQINKLFDQLGQNREAQRAAQLQEDADRAAGRPSGTPSRYADQTVGVLQRLDALQESANIYLAQIAGNTALMAGAGAFVGGSAFSNVTINVHLHGVDDRAYPFGQAVGAAIADQALNRRVAVRQSAKGAYPRL